jgi:hypothetical protein
MILAMLVLLTSCQDDFVDRGAWVPAIEQTGFEYLRESGVRIQTALQAGREELAAGNVVEAMTSLADAENATNILLYFDVPITEVRQLIYDAGRMHALQRQQEALTLLDRSAHVLLEVEQHGGNSVQQAIQELSAMTSDLQMLLAEEARAMTARSKTSLSIMVARKFEELGHKVNLLALKSDMILSDADFG